MNFAILPLITGHDHLVPPLDNPLFAVSNARDSSIATSRHFRFWVRVNFGSRRQDRISLTRSARPKRFLSFNNAERSSYRFEHVLLRRTGKMREPQLETIGEDRVFVRGDETRGVLSTRKGRGNERKRERTGSDIFVAL